MSLYIHPNNQTLLWNLINKNQLISTIFTTSQKTEWFKQIISQIYSTLPENISREILLNKNKETLSIMVNDLKSRTIQQPIYSSNEIEKPISINTEFEQRQKEYDSMMKKPVVKEISFEEEKGDGVIKNMDELIQQQLRERQLDLERISKTYENKPVMLNIKEPIPKQELIVETIDERSEKKKVSWGADSTIEYHFILEKKIEDLTEKYDNLLKYLESKFPTFLNDFSEKMIVKEILFEQIERIEKQN